MQEQAATAKSFHSNAKRLVWALWVIFLLLQIAALVFAILARSYPPDANDPLALLTRAWLYLPASVAFATIGALIAAHQPRNPIGWLFLAMGLVSAFSQIAEGYWRYALFVRPGTLPAGELMLWINVRPYFFLPLFSALLVLFFPTGGPPSRRWWVVGWLIIGGGLTNVVANAFIPDPLDVSVTITNPLGLSDAVRFLRFSAALGNYLLLLGALGAVMSLVVRFRRAGAVERQQIKWLAYALAFYVASIGLATSLITPTGRPSPLVNLLFVVQAFSGALVAVAGGIAMLRHHLFDIDIIIRRTLVYAALSLTLGLLYIGCILLSRALIAPYLGGSELAIVVSTLLIAALFNPLRRRIQSVIDRRFYRRKYDAAKVLQAFAATARDETDLERLTDAMLRVADETMQPEFVGLWLREPASQCTLDGARPSARSP